jgi:hypothetical protein
MALTTFERLTINLLTELAGVVLLLKLPEENRTRVVRALSELATWAATVQRTTAPPPPPPPKPTPNVADIFEAMYGPGSPFARSPFWNGRPYAPPEQPKPWWFAELGLTEWPISRETVATAFKTLAAKRHPDAGGSHEAFVRLGKARDEALSYLGVTIKSKSSESGA